MTRANATRLSLLVGCILIGGVAVLAMQPAASLTLSEAEEPPHSSAQPPTPTDHWLSGSVEEKFAQIERHLRGLDQSMAEIGYRYGELHFAAKSQNWEYARYQTEKIELSLRLAIERRPKRAKTSEVFLSESLPPVFAAIDARDATQLAPALEQLHAGCVQCHQAENVLYFKEAVDRIRARSQHGVHAKSP